MCYYALFKIYAKFRCDLTYHTYHIILHHTNHSIFGILAKCAGMDVAKFSKASHMRCGSVQSKKLLCAKCVGVPKLTAHKYSDKSICHLVSSQLMGLALLKKIWLFFMQQYNKQFTLSKQTVTQPIYPLIST